MTINQINALRDTFRAAMLDWDVPVSITIEDDTANVSFKLWRTKFEGNFNHVENDKWSDGNDCPHYIENSESVWQWIAMQLHDYTA